MERKIVGYLIEGKSYRWMIKQLRIGDRRIRRISGLAKAYGYLSGETPIPPFPEALFPDPTDGRSQKMSDVDRTLLEKKDWIEDCLKAGWRPVTIWEELGSSGTNKRSSFYRFLHRHGLYDIGRHYRKRVVPEIVHDPGECLQLDWGKLRSAYDPMTGKNRTLWMFIGVLGYSRFTMVRLVWTNNTTTTLAAIESMFQELGGVPKKITSDNPKCFALEASVYEPLLNPAFERFAAHYGVQIECLPPRDPQKKGKVERQMPYVRRLYEAHGKEWKGVEESQQYLDKKLEFANQRKHGTTLRKPIEDLLEVEVKELSPLPAVAYEIEECAEAKVRQDGHVRFANKYYSLEEKYSRESVLCIGNSTTVSIYHKGKLIEVHEKLTDPNRSKQTKSHHLKPWEQSIQDGSMYRKRAQKIGPDVDRLVTIILGQGAGFIDTRKIWGILSLDKKYPAEKINEVCRTAIELESCNYRTVIGLLKLKHIPIKDKPEQIPDRTKPEKPYKFVRSLDEYTEQLELLH
jgi:hypothetical protein